MELEFVTLAEDPIALEKLPAEQGLTGCQATCYNTCTINFSCLNHYTCEIEKSKTTIPIPTIPM